MGGPRLAGHKLVAQGWEGPLHDGSEDGAKAQRGGNTHYFWIFMQFHLKGGRREGKHGVGALPATLFDVAAHGSWTQPSFDSAHLPTASL